MPIRDQIIDFMKMTGPVLPVQVAKKINTDILIASAHLSELIGSKDVKVTSVRVGGTPIYYLPSQKEQLQKYSSYLHEKERRAYDLLKEKKILRNSKLEPLIRVALQNTKDFAVPLQVRHNGDKEIFWKWYLLDNTQAEELIKSEYDPPKEPVIDQSADSKTSTSTKPASDSFIEPKPVTVAFTIPSVEPAIKPVTGQSVTQESNKETGAISTKEYKQEISRKQPVNQNPAKAEPSLKKPEKSQNETQSKLQHKNEPVSEFSSMVNNYFTTNKITVIDENIIRKNSESEYIIELPSAVGKLTYYCRAKSKKKVNDGDLSSLFITGQIKKLPVLFLTLGTLTKRAEEMLHSEFKGMQVKKI
ncbi:MAG: hypothetical protein ABIC04_08865 [Nanoarchaeota archaeon]